MSGSLDLFGEVKNIRGCAEVRDVLDIDFPVESQEAYRDTQGCPAFYPWSEGQKKGSRKGQGGTVNSQTPTDIF